MKQMYKVLISISLLLILASVLVNALETDEKGNINPNVQENIAKGKPTPKPTPTPTPIPYSAIFAMIDDQSHPINFSANIVSSNWTEVTNFTFYLPKNSYVYVESNGFLSNYFSDAGLLDVKMEVDDVVDSSTRRSYYLASPDGGCDGCYTGFQTARTYYLYEGVHTIHLYGVVTRISEGIPTVIKTSITTIINENGDIQYK